MKKININLIAVNSSRAGIENVPEWNSLESFNKHVIAIAAQKDWQMYFPMEAVIKFYNLDSVLQDVRLIRLNQPMEIIK